ncbi:hypothetical protein BPAE_0164g00120 [Botrytis paeoniae]|uniref:Xylanolytic transcriptional activator regulatory domain-containing protein n=1 Tax=Botrytis paeoniae TaxID=278948 RepID=A0A4Z1FDE8_9HELO|nr:hypothetical protein BPAE_0164g00120 [Botrytis paeoniae]
MVLAIGAVMSTLSPDKDAKVMASWASYLSSRAMLSGSTFEDASLKGVHLLLLKSICAIELMRPNDSYIYVGHAALNALALGMNRAQVANSTRPNMHRLRVTFWNLYSTEKLMSLFHDRASCLRDDLIDTAFPEDLPSFETENGNPEEITDMAYVRAMATLGRVADLINSGLYFYGRVATDSANIPHVTRECELALEKAMGDLPPFLHFFGSTMPPSPHLWHEVQRTYLGLHYYHCIILIHRPARVFVAEALTAAQELGFTDIFGYVEKAMSASKKLIALALDAYNTRATSMRQDSGAAYNIVGACLTLLYDVIGGPKRSCASNVADIFKAVEDGLRCLSFMEHSGPEIGGTLSSRIMRVAKDAFCSAQGPNSDDVPGGNGTAAYNTAPLYQPIQESTEAVNTIDNELDTLLGQFPWLADTTANTPISHSATETPLANTSGPLHNASSVNFPTSSGYESTSQPDQLQQYPTQAFPQSSDFLFMPFYGLGGSMPQQVPTHEAAVADNTSGGSNTGANQWADVNGQVFTDHGMSNGDSVLWGLL